MLFSISRIFVSNGYINLKGHLSTLLSPHLSKSSYSYFDIVSLVSWLQIRPYSSTSIVKGALSGAQATPAH